MSSLHRRDAEAEPLLEELSLSYNSLTARGFNI